jgi:aminopeptidase N
VGLLTDWFVRGIADARKALPCWDEPAVKAQFEVTLTCPSHMTVRVMLALQPVYVPE